MQPCSPKGMRSQGVLAVKGTDKKYVFQGVHMIFDGEFDLSHEWKPGGKRECRFVFIGRNVDREELERGILDCQVKPLRFQVGDRVEVNVDSPGLSPLAPKEKWIPGTIVDVWEGGNPYRVKTDIAYEVDTPDGKWPFAAGTEVDCARDVDSYIRKPAGPRSSL